LREQGAREPFFEVGEAARGDHPPSGEHHDHEEKRTDLAAPHEGMLADELAGRVTAL
jgi:hypothetical protein